MRKKECHISQRCESRNCLSADFAKFRHSHISQRCESRNVFPADAKPRRIRSHLAEM